MNVFWVNIEVSFSSVMNFMANKADIEKGADGFFQEIGCSANNKKELKQMILGYLSESDWLEISECNVIFDRIGKIDFHEIESEIYNDPDINKSLKGDPYYKGIWYTSGRAFYTDDDNSDIYEVEIVER